MHINKGYSGITVELVNASHFANWEEAIFDMAKTTWASMENVEYNEQNKEHVDLVFGSFEGRTLPTVLELLNFVFVVKGMSRTCSHQFVRGRVGWVFNQQSQMPEPIKRNITIPAHVFQVPGMEEKLKAWAELTESLYDKMIEAKLPPQTARYVLPEGSNTDIMCQVNFPALRGFVANRTCFSTNDEINFIARMMRNEAIKVDARFGKYLTQPCDKLGKCTLTDDVFPCCGKYEWPKPHKPKYGNKQNNALYEMALRPELAMHETDMAAANAMKKIHDRSVEQ